MRGNKKNLNLGLFEESVKVFTPVQAAYYAEAAIIALENQGHLPGIELKVEGRFQHIFTLNWRKFTYTKSGWKEPRNIAENGSIAIGILLILELTEYQVIEQSVIGTGFDFWLGFKEDHENYDPYNFLNGRLELSGINKGSQSKISQRVKEKLQQLKVSDYLKIPAYVVVTEFGTPASIILDNE